MKIIFNILTIFCFLFVSGCGSKHDTLGDKIDNSVQKVEDKAKEIDKKAKEKAAEMDKKAHASPKKSAPIAITFENKDDNLTVIVDLKKSVQNLIIQANPLDGLEIMPVANSNKNSYEEPTILRLPVVLKNHVGRLGIYVSGTFDGSQLAQGVTYNFPDSGKSKKISPKTEIDGNGDVIRVMPAKEK